MLQILTDKKFLVISDASSGDELIDLKVLLKTENRIAKLVEKEMESEKGSHLSPRFDRRASEGRRRLDQEPN
ncbi:MAG: hypothetical protein HYW48_10640 [Deltaproteobacteria bacterium]|nr:hypothetical protein [Deltaproteobacteria bacterium]